MGDDAEDVQDNRVCYMRSQEDSVRGSVNGSLTNSMRDHWSLVQEDQCMAWGCSCSCSLAVVSVSSGKVTRTGHSQGGCCK